MGEITEMVLDGTLCELCFSYLGEFPKENENHVEWEPPGYPHKCKNCKKKEKD